MTWDEYNKLFHKLELNRHAFRPLMECDHEVLQLVNAAIDAEREACAKLCETYETASIRHEAPSTAMIFNHCAKAIRARSRNELPPQ
jgi:hypothetical protein